MTIFAYDGKTLVSDCSEYKYGVVVNDKATKVVHYEKDDLSVTFAAAGSTSLLRAMQAFMCRMVRDWTYSINSVTNLVIEDRDEYAKLFNSGEDYDNIVIMSDGRQRQAYYFGKHPYPIKVSAPYAGGQQDAVLVAMGALHAGASAKDAVKIAVKLTGIAQVNGEFTQFGSTRAELEYERRQVRRELLGSLPLSLTEGT